jgi:hypothetical protein
MCVKKIALSWAGNTRKLRQAHGSPAPCVELRLHGTALITVVSVTHQRSWTSQAIESRRTALGSRQCYDETWRSIRSRRGRYEANERDEQVSHDGAAFRWKSDLTYPRLAQS